MKGVRLGILWLWLFALGPVAPAGVPLDGLAVALSPDGDQLAIAGRNRTLYLIDTTTLEVTVRHYLGSAIRQLVYGNAETLWLLDDEARLLRLDTATGELEILVKEEVQTMAAAVEAGRLAYAIEDGSDSIVRLVSLVSGEPLHEWRVEEPYRVEALGIAPEGNQVGFLSKAFAHEQENANGKETLPPGLDKGERRAWNQERDGRAAMVTVWDTQEGSELWTRETFFVATGTTRGVISRNQFVVAGFGNFNAVIPSEGPIVTFAAPNRLNYGVDFSLDATWLYTGGEGEGAFTPLAEPDLALAWEIDADMLQPDERFLSFAGRADGPIYATTSAWRLFEFDEAGRLLRVTAVY